MFSTEEIAESFADAWVIAGKPDEAWQAFSSSQVRVWPMEREHLTEMFRQAFESSTNRGERV